MPPPMRTPARFQILGGAMASLIFKQQKRSLDQRRNESVQDYHHLLTRLPSNCHAQTLIFRPAPVDLLIVGAAAWRLLQPQRVTRRACSSTGQSNGLRNHRLGVRIPPGVVSYDQ